MVMPRIVYRVQVVKISDAKGGKVGGEQVTFVLVGLTSDEERKEALST